MRLPSEWQAACKSSKLLSEFIKKYEKDNKGSTWLINLVLFTVAYAIIAFASLDSAFIKSTLMVIGILTGFVINTLIFIGRDGRVNLLSLEDSKEYAEKIKFLLWTQLGTLKVFLTYITVALVYLILAKENFSVFWFPAFLAILQVCLLWLLIFGLVRTLLLPLQIYDLHAFNLEQLIQEKEAEAKKALEEAKNQE